MELQQLTTFRTVAAIGSFSQAAEVLGYAQSTVSEHIRSLEAELKTRLFKRAGSKRIALTPAGELLLRYGQKMLNLEAEIKSEVVAHTESQGSLSIRIPETVSIHFLPPILQRFRQRFPKANLGFHELRVFRSSGGAFGGDRRPGIPHHRRFSDARSGDGNAMPHSARARRPSRASDCAGRPDRPGAAQGGTADRSGERLQLRTDAG